MQHCKIRTVCFQDLYCNAYLLGFVIRTVLLVFVASQWRKFSEALP